MYTLNIKEHCYHQYQASLIPNSCRANDIEPSKNSTKWFVKSFLNAQQKILKFNKYKNDRSEKSTTQKIPYLFGYWENPWLLIFLLSEPH